METISKKQLVDQIAAKTDATKTDINTFYFWSLHFNHFISSF